jgi:hypothetical protein
MKDYAKIILLWILSVILVIMVMSYGTYLIKNNYIIECFTPFIAKDLGSPETNHNVNLPINTSFSCKNMCGPLARCSITGEQCTSDVDCFGCVPKINKKKQINTENVLGVDESGKLTMGVTPTYSTLTTDIGTRASLINKDTNEKPPEYNLGVDLWKSSFDNDYKLFNKRYKPPGNLTYEPNYPNRFTMSGEFMDDGPLASNAY